MTSIDTAPDLGTRVEESLMRVFRDAFPNVAIHSYSDPGERTSPSIGIKAEQGAEDPIGTNIFPVSIDIETVNLNAAQRQLMSEMIGNSISARATISEFASKQFSLPKGDAVEVLASPRTVEDENGRITTYSLLATLQPI